MRYRVGAARSVLNYSDSCWLAEGNTMSRRFFGGATFLSHAAWWTGMSTLREDAIFAAWTC